MNKIKSIIIFTILLSLVFSLFGGIVPAYATPHEHDEDCLTCVDDNGGEPAEPADPVDPVEPVDPNLPDVPDLPVVDADDMDGEVADSHSVQEASLSVLRTFTAIEQFVIRLYLDAGGAGYDDAGLARWAGLLGNGRRTGVSVAFEFFFSDDFIDRRIGDSDFVTMLYKTLLDREPTSMERAQLEDMLYKGYPREDAFAIVVNSSEFNDFCRQAGISRETYTPPKGAMARVFATRLYRTALQREPDFNGLNHWHNSLINGRKGAIVAFEFIFSREMHNRNLSDEDFVEILYNALMGRDSDAGGKAHWVKRLSTGRSRYKVYKSFVGSKEFKRICKEHGIKRGSAPKPKNRMQGDSMVASIWNLMIEAQFRGISDRPEHIAGIIGNLQCEAGLSLCPFQQELGNNKAGLGLMQWSFGRRTALETYMWNSGINQVDFNLEMNKHSTSICSNPRNMHPPKLLNSVLAVQVNYMFHELRNTSERLYMDYVTFPAKKSGAAGARAYAELFCSISLRPGSGGTNAQNDIIDKGVQDALRASPYSGGAGRLDRISYSGLAIRRDRAANVYQQFLTGHR